MLSNRRLIRLVVVMAIIGAPAAVLRLTCTGNACDQAGAASSSAVAVPFCSLPADTRALVSAGYRVERSADVFTVSRQPGIAGQVPGGATGAASLWPSLASGAATKVPIAFSGPGVPSKLPTGPVGLVDIGPTIAKAVHLDWQFPQYRAGRTLPGFRAGPAPPLVLVVAWKGVGSDDLRAAPKDWPFLRSLVGSGAGTLDGQTGSLPVDSTAALTTIGTGGLPTVHGITGTLIRNPKGDLVTAWGPDAPVSVINGLGDAMSNQFGLKTKIGLAATQPFDRGIIGGNWFPGPDRDVIRTVPSPRIPAQAEQMLGAGFGSVDAGPDLLAVTLDGTVASQDRATARIVAAANKATGGDTFVVVAGTGSSTSTVQPSMQATEITDTVNRAAGAEVTQAAANGALFLDQQLMADKGISQGGIVDALKGLRTGATSTMADVFPAYAISFARYC